MYTGIALPAFSWCLGFYTTSHQRSHHEFVIVLLLPWGVNSWIPGWPATYIADNNTFGRLNIIQPSTNQSWCNPLSAITALIFWHCQRLTRIVPNFKPALKVNIAASGFSTLYVHCEAAPGRPTYGGDWQSSTETAQSHRATIYRDPFHYLHLSCNSQASETELSQ